VGGEVVRHDSLRIRRSDVSAWTVAGVEELSGPRRLFPESSLHCNVRRHPKAPVVDGRARGCRQIDNGRTVTLPTYHASCPGPWTPA
jgi:hypothetical protein